MLKVVVLLFKDILKLASFLDTLSLLQKEIFLFLERFILHLRHELCAALPEEEGKAPVVNVGHGALYR